MQVVERDNGVAIDELARQGRADEAGAAGDEDPLALERHAATVTTSSVESRPCRPFSSSVPDGISGGRSCSAKELGLRVVAVDRNPEAPGLAEADIAKVVDFSDVAAVLKATGRINVDGVLTVSADRAVPVVAAVAEARGLPGIGVETAHLMTHKVAMRRRLAEAGCRSRGLRRSARSPSGAAPRTRSGSRPC